MKKTNAVLFFEIVGELARVIGLIGGISAFFVIILHNGIAEKDNLNQTQTQLNEIIDWIKENSEIRNKIYTCEITSESGKIFIVNYTIPYKKVLPTDMDFFDNYHLDDLIYKDFQNNHYRYNCDKIKLAGYFLIGTNISTERFFR